MMRLIFFAFASFFLLNACGSNETDKEPTDPNGPSSPPTQLLPGLPESLAGFDAWLKMNKEPIPPKGSDPHLGVKEVYINQTRETIAPGGERKYPYPDGAIIVKSAVRPGKEFIGLVAVMTKKKGTNPNHNDWEFIEYLRDGANESFRLAFQGRPCENCHVRAADTDYSFTVLE